MKKTAEALWKSDSVMVRGDREDDAVSFFCTGLGFDHTLCEHACESLARAVASCVCVATMKKLLERSLSPDALKVKASVVFGESAKVVELDSVQVNVTACGCAMSLAAFREAVDDARRHCPVCRLLEQRVSIEANIEPEFITAAM